MLKLLDLRPWWNNVFKVIILLNIWKKVLLFYHYLFGLGYTPGIQHF